MKRAALTILYTKIRFFQVIFKKYRLLDFLLFNIAIIKIRPCSKFGTRALFIIMIIMQAYPSDRVKLFQISRRTNDPRLPVC